LYFVSKEYIEYVPKKKEDSSSGVYSGGDYFKKDISLDDFLDIRKSVKNVISKPEFLIEKRVMGSGFIKIVKKNKEEIYIVKGDIDEIVELEKKLSGLIR